MALRCGLFTLRVKTKTAREPVEWFLSEVFLDHFQGPWPDRFTFFRHSFCLSVVSHANHLDVHWPGDLVRTWRLHSCEPPAVVLLKYVDISARKRLGNLAEVSNSYVGLCYGWASLTKDRCAKIDVHRWRCWCTALFDITLVQHRPFMTLASSVGCSEDKVIDPTRQRRRIRRIYSVLLLDGSLHHVPTPIHQSGSGVEAFCL